MKKLLLFVLFLSLPGCGLMMLPVLIDKMGDFAERMAKIEAEKRAELRKESHSIEGEILSTEVIEKEIEVKKPNFKIENNKPTEEFTIEKVLKKIYLVKFIDGRDIEFSEVCEKPLNKGVYYIVKYNGLNEITDVQNEQK